VLVVEDDAQLADVLARGLRQAGLAVDTAPDGAMALELAGVNAYVVIVLDRNLPDLHGDEVCRRLLRAADAPRIIMLTADGNIGSRVDGLAAGADDYLPKPFAMVELVARIHALARRPSRATLPILAVGDLLVEPAQHRASRAGRLLALTPKEFGVLLCLATAPGTVISAERLLETVWDERADPFTNAVRITMMTLRRKLGEPPLIETVVGAGYRLTGEPA
jgi:DNA-binding response OmpR family regulator